jgi:hypothetical protein
MNCFEWQNRASDYLDGTLIGALKRGADDHLDACPSCQERHKHYRLLLTTLAGQSRSTLPISIRKSPLSVTLPRLQLSERIKGSWELLPWFLRTGIEGSGIVFLILLAISVGPKLRTLYESKIEQSFNEFSESLSRDDSSPEKAYLRLPLSRGNAQYAASVRAGDEFASEGNESESDSEDEDHGTEVNDGDIRVGKSEIWRFNLKTDSPHEIRPNIVRLLTELKISPDTPGLGGVEAPGGIQFDLLVPQSAVPGIKKQLQKLAPFIPEGQGPSALGEAFTWYKNKSKNPIPTGYTKVVIWLSQM